MTGRCSRFLGRLIRRKRVTDQEIEQTSLARCLSLLDLTALGVGATLGAGAYVLAGQVAKRDAGPAVIVSFLIAAATSVLSGLCYSEFGARVPKAGSAYLYTYVTVGELMAFVIGWNLILEYIIGAACVARTASGYFDALFGDKLVSWFSSNLPMDVWQLAPYADLLAFGVTMALTGLLASGVKESAMATKIMTGLNLLVLGFVIISGAFHDNAHNWAIPADQLPPDNPCDHTDNVTFCGTGGFAPYGFEGIIKGAATCFFAFVGFDAIATTGEEAKNPQRNIPLATIISLFIVFIVYFGISLTVTMVAPYYALDTRAPFATIFKNVGWTVPMYVVSVGAIIALTTSLLGGLFPLPRVLFAMSTDGLLFRFLSKVNQRSQTPMTATLISGTVAAFMAAVFDVDALVEMLSIGTLLAYTLVAASVILLRYDTSPVQNGSTDFIFIEKISLSTILSNPMTLMKPIDHRPSTFSSTASKYLTAALTVLLVGICVFLNFAPSSVFSKANWWAILTLALLGGLSLSAMLLISRQPENTDKLYFKTPLVPYLPAVSMFVNTYLMINLNPLTWFRFTIWMGIGFIIYFGYGIWHSSEETPADIHKASSTTKIDQEGSDCIRPVFVCRL